MTLPDLDRLFLETDRLMTQDDLRESRLAALRLVRKTRFSVTVIIDRAKPLVLSFHKPPTLQDVCSALEGREIDTHVIAVRLDTLTQDLTIKARLAGGGM